MSAPNWLKDASPFQNGENGAFPHPTDPSMGFMPSPASANFDMSQMGASQVAQPLLNGNLANGAATAGVPGALYNTQSSIPSKRSRPADENVRASPGPYPASHPASRSQTPLSTFPNYTTPVNGAFQQGPNPYQPPATQSPAMSNQPFNAPNSQQRLQTMSPSPYSPTPQNMSGHASPPHGESGSRVSTPQTNPPPFPPNQAFGVAPGMMYGQQPNAPMNGGSPSPFNANMSHNAQMNDPRMRQLGQAGNLRGPPTPGMQYHPGGQGNPQMPNMSSAQMRPQPQQRPPNQVFQQMLQHMMHFTRQRGQQFNAQPVIAGKPWPHAAQFLGFPPPQCIMAAQELQAYWQSNLAEYEIHYVQQQQQQQPPPPPPPNRQHTISKSSPMAAGAQPPDVQSKQAAFTTPKALQDQQARLAQPPTNPASPYDVASKQFKSGQQPPRIPNAPIDLQQAQAQAMAPNPYAQLGNVPQDQRRYMPAARARGSPAGANKMQVEKKRDLDNAEDWRSIKKPLTEMYIPRVNYLEIPVDGAAAAGSDTEGRPMDAGNQAWSSSYGGLPVTENGFLGSVESLLKFKLRAPTLTELGPIDLQAIILSISSGIHGEIRYALDTLVALSLTQTQHRLDRCYDLVEALVDCATDQIEFLEEHASDTQEEQTVHSYEDLVRHCKREINSVDDYVKAGSLDDDLDSAATRLMCITTILRNFSFGEVEGPAVADPNVVRMMASVLRHLSTRALFLRTHRNALDFSKDFLIYLSQTADHLVLETKDVALGILSFLVGFGPSSTEQDVDPLHLTFNPYTPSQHRYLPVAIDSLAKLLTRQSNRAIFRSIFANEASSSTSSELLTKAFAMSSCPIPDIDLDAQYPLMLLNQRIPFLIQGLLAAEILAEMIPGSEHGLVSSWMNSSDCLLSRIIKMITVLLGRLPGAQSKHRPQNPKDNADVHGYMMLVDRALGLLVKLSEKAAKSDSEGHDTLQYVLQDKKSFVEALESQNMDRDVLRKLCNLDHANL